METVLNLEGSDNCRDIGHNITKYGEVKKKKIIRSSQLSNISNNDIEQLKSYGVKKIIDLRGIKEREIAPDKNIESVDNIHIPIFNDFKIPVLNDWYIRQKFPKVQLLEEDLLQQKKRMMKIYRNFVKKQSSLEALRKIFQILVFNSIEERSVLFHCTMGKDRTGFVVALILSALGVEKDDIINDYLLTNKCLIKRINSITTKLYDAGVSDSVIKYVHKYFLANEEYLEESFKTINMCYNSMNEFLSIQLGITDYQQVALYDNYTRFCS